VPMLQRFKSNMGAGQYKWLAAHAFTIATMRFKLQELGERLKPTVRLPRRPL
jgi:hypothetical protein